MYIIIYLSLFCKGNVKNIMLFSFEIDIILALKTSSAWEYRDCRMEYKQALSIIFKRV